MNIDSNKVLRNVLGYALALVAIGAALGLVYLRSALRYGGRTGSLPAPRSNGVFYAKKEWIGKVKDLRVKKKAQIDRFWEVIAISSDEFLSPEPLTTMRSDAISEALDQVEPGLSWEFASTGNDQVLYISCLGDVAKVPHVYSLVETAPQNLGFRVQAFMPKDLEFPGWTVADIPLTLENVMFSLSRDGDDHGIDLHVDRRLLSLGGGEDDDLDMAAYDLLQAAMGEWVLMERMDYFRFNDSKLAPESAAPLVSLDKVVRQMPSNFTSAK